MISGVDQECVSASGSNIAERTRRRQSQRQHKFFTNFSFDMVPGRCHALKRKGGEAAQMRLIWVITPRCVNSHSRVDASRGNRDRMATAASPQFSLAPSPKQFGRTPRCAQVSGQSPRPSRHSCEPEVASFRLYQVLWCRGVGCNYPTRRCHINGESAFSNSPAVKGGVLIHGPRLVAQPVGSEWRTRLPYWKYIQIQSKEKKCIVI